MAQRVDGRGAAEAGAKGGVEPLAVYSDEQADAPVGSGAGQHRQDAEQQQMGQRVALTLGTAWITNRAQGGEQLSKGSHGDLRARNTRSTARSRRRPRPRHGPAECQLTPELNGPALTPWYSSRSLHQAGL